MRLTIDLVRRAPQFTNTLLQREVDLRGLRISSLDEHVLVLLDNSFDVINLSSNALAALEYFPTKTVGGKDVRMSRVTTLIAHRNELQRVSVASCVLALPNLAHFAADRNRLTAVRDLHFLKNWKKLETLSLEENPVWESNSDGFDSEKLRAFLVFLCPRLRLINYQRVTQADRDRVQDAKEEFKSLVRSWEAPLAATGAASPSPAEGKKVRKRGREGRAAAAAAVVVSEVAAAAASPEEDATDDSAYPAAAPPAAPAAPDDADDDDVTLQARLDQLEERLLADDVTAEEMAQLEEEMTEISTKMAAARRRRRH